jgi:4-hydroxybenzoate polyprenyltransferase
MYAMADRPDDLKIGVKSSAILFGEADRLIIGGLQLTVLLILLLVGQQLGFGLFYYLGLLVAAGFGVYEQYLIRDRDPQKCFRAFLNNNWFGLAVFTGLVLNYL